MGERWQYTGTGTPRSYGDYVDTATGRQLLAEPGGEYGIRATWDVLPVPPDDGWWKPAAGTVLPGLDEAAVSHGDAPGKAAPSGTAKGTPAGASSAA